MRTTRAVRLGASGVLCVAGCLLGDILKLGALWGFFHFCFILYSFWVFLPEPASKQGYWKGLAKMTQEAQMTINFVPG